MAAEPFFKVAHVREDGWAHDITLQGYGAEALAFQLMSDLKKSKHIRYAVVLQRTALHVGVSWEVRREFHNREGGG